MSEQSQISAQQQLVDTLRVDLEKERQLRLKLEDECDLLAVENDRLRTEMRKLKDLIKVSSSRGDLPPAPGPNTLASDLFAQPISHFSQQNCIVYRAREKQATIENVCNGKNVIAVCFSRVPRVISSTTGGVRSTVGSSVQIVSCGGADGSICGFDARTQKQLYALSLSAPVLCMQSHGLRIACGLMSGGLCVIQIQINTTSDTEDPEISACVVWQVNHHHKYTISVCWSGDGSLLATGSHDKSVNVYKVKPESNAETSESEELIEKLTFVPFDTIVESLVFVNGGISTPSASARSSAASLPAQEALSVTSSDDWELVVGLRGVPHLIYMNCGSSSGTATLPTMRRVSLNEREWDSHVSFTPLYLSLSPNGRILLVSTDKNMHIMLLVGTNTRVGVLSGHCGGDYYKPVTTWGHDGQYIYSNSEGENTVYVFDAARGSLVSKLSGHTGIVRCIAVDNCTPTKLDTEKDISAIVHDAVASVSYDKSLVLWSSAA